MVIQHAQRVGSKGASSNAALVQSGQAGKQPRLDFNSFCAITFAILVSEVVAFSSDQGVARVLLWPKRLERFELVMCLGVLFRPVEDLVGAS